MSICVPIQECTCTWCTWPELTVQAVERRRWTVSLASLASYPNWGVPGPSKSLSFKTWKTGPEELYLRLTSDLHILVCMHTYTTHTRDRDIQMSSCLQFLTWHNLESSGHVLEELSWLMINVEGPSPLWAVPTLSRCSWDVFGKQAEEPWRTSQKATSSHALCFSFQFPGSYLEFLSSFL